jgi:hypothetical protein
MALTAYQQQTQRLLHDPNAQAYSLADLTTYINIARSQIALEGECIRVLLSGGMITALAITGPGTGYSGTASVSITGALGAQAFATASLAGGSVASVTLTAGGWGYIPASAVSVLVTGSTGGSNASVSATVDNSATTITGQETIQFSALNAVFSTWNANGFAGNPNPVLGLNQVLKVFDIACNQNGTYKPMLTQKVWSEFQAYLRIYSNTQQNYPTYWSQYLYGIAGSIYLFPWPAQPLQLDVDCCASPIALVTDSTVEAIPYPWTDAIPYYAAYLAYENSQRKEDADRMFKLYEMFMTRSRAYSETPFMPDWYGYEY